MAIQEREGPFAAFLDAGDPAASVQAVFSWSARHLSGGPHANPYRMICAQARRAKISAWLDSELMHGETRVDRAIPL